MKRKSIDLQSVVDMQESPAVVIDKDYKIIAANRRYCDSYGVKPDEIVGCRCHQVSHRSAVPCHENGEHCPHRETFSTGQACEVLHTHFDRNGHPDHVRIKAFPLTDNQGQRMLMETIYRLAPDLEIDCDDMRMVGRSPAFLSCIEALTVAARSGAHVLVDGESGVGKELAARFVHDQSSRNTRAYVEMNCAAITESLCEDELFGHERGAFTGCVGTKQGLCELADGGTLFLDEIGEMPLSMQAKLLRVLDAGAFRRVGGQETLQADFRVVAATNRDLSALVAEGKFREDLYYRIAGIRVTVPPLRKRCDDIPALAQILVERLCKNKTTSCRLTERAMNKLRHYEFPGNIRELRNILQKAMALTETGVIDAEQIDITENPVQKAGENTPDVAVSFQQAEKQTLSIAEMECQHIIRLLTHYHGNKRRVAKALAISERTLYRKIKKYELSDLAAKARKDPLYEGAKN